MCFSFWLSWLFWFAYFPGVSFWIFSMNCMVVAAGGGAGPQWSFEAKNVEKWHPLLKVVLVIYISGLWNSSLSCRNVWVVGLICVISFLPGSAYSSRVLYLECVSSQKGFISILILAKIGFVAWRASEDCSVISAHGASLFRSPVFGGRAHTVMLHPPLCWVRLGDRAGCLLPAQVSTLPSLDSAFFLSQA